MKNHFLGNLSRFHLWVDVFLLNVSYLIAGSVLFESLGAFQDHQYLNLLLLTNLVWIGCFSLFGLYQFTSGSYNSFNQLGKILITYDVHLIVMESYLYFSDTQTGLRENLVFLSFEIFAASSVALHILITLLIRHFRTSARRVNKYAIVGNGEPASWFSDFRGKQHEMGYHFCGVFQMNEPDNYLPRLESFMEQEKLDFLYCNPSGLSNEQMSAVLKLAERKKTQIRLIPNFYGFQMNKVNFDPAASYPAYHVSSKPSAATNERAMQKMFEIPFALFVVIVGLPLFLLVKLTSRRPVFSRQMRAVKWAKSFQMLRLRTHPYSWTKNLYLIYLTIHLVLVGRAK
ncbi:nucleoside-diphosphate sugar epimerase/dehydratase [Dyadobacter luticola]|uniref:Bacterial sugar transferase domain-containing protein n=1 Tax=Dyadobacter luticola TaxID=1979387 RepID=A0A5R9L3T0_9BACT|nr:hypothetical protein [Dyadobacter luticola]TLV03234.1 hypothetical protein FEN17_06380 [Dyadobacter luticola]